jgi:amino acid transporter
VRELSLYDSLLVNLAIINIAGGLAYAAWQLFFFPGASLTLVFLLAGIPGLGLFIVYTIFSGIYPRTGGDYVYNSRILHPVIGVACGMLNVFGFFIFALTAFNAWYVVYTGLPSLFTAMNVVTGDPSYAAASAFISSQIAVDFVISTFVLIFGALIVLFGMKVFRRAFFVIFLYYFLITVALAVALFATSRQAFIASLNAIGGAGTYQKVLSNAGPPYNNYQFSLIQTLLAFMPLGFFVNSGFQATTYVGSEVRDPRRTQVFAIGLSFAIALIYLVLTAYQSSVVFGDAFLQSVDYLYATNPSLLPFVATPFVTFLVSLVYRNPISAFLLNSVPIIGGFLLIPSTLLAASRIFFAMSFDRVLPESMSAVNERFHSPINCVGLMCVIAEIWVAVLYFYGFISSWLSLSLATPVAWALTAIAAIVFPYTKKGLYEEGIKGLPQWMQRKPFGIPMLVIGGIIQLVTMILWIAAEFSPLIAYMYLGPLIDSALAVTGGIILISIILYYGMRAYRLRSGLDISIAYKEIPPE